jgi:NADPH2:quinone reductase
VGAGVTELAPGRRVLAFCGSGGMAEELAVDSGRVLPIPDAMDFMTAGGFAVTYGTAYHALNDRARLQPGETLLVLGAAGGVGLAAVEIGKALSARVIACASTDEKLALCRRWGADDTINYTAESLRDRVKALMAGKGVDVVFDPVGGDFSEVALRGLAWMGRYLVVGFAAGDIPRIPLNLVLLKSAAVLGVAWGAAMAANPVAGRAGLMELLSWSEAGRLKPHISATYPLDRAAEAIGHVARRNAKGKVVLQVE